ncbi:efflux RND transporter permease subunit [Phenylobacterium sp. LjRoot219]|uniref:efflux RND transporter permease subunit n=1 Tax=Phenylobacterium sp. LjRoot219 TaxID=3342283 RepID=UPI003ED139C5
MISRIFIDRPVFAWVIAIAIMLAGVAGIRSLSVAQYPDVAPATVNVRAVYPGASAEVLEASVTQVIEQQLTGLDGMIYFSSSSSSAGRTDITVTFDKGVNPDIAQVQVQNKVQQALPRLPQEVQQQGLTITKANNDFLAILALYDETDRSTSGDIGDYLVSHLQEPIARIEGVGEVNVFGSQYAMRIWLDPFKLSSFNLTPEDVTTALRAQNAQVAAGEVGGLPSAPGQMLNATVTAQSRLTSPEQFRAIVLKTQPDGSIVTLDQVARVELGQESYNVISRLNRHPGAGLQVTLAPGADALKTSDLLHAEVAKRAKDFPPGYKYAFPNEAASFIKLSVKEVVKTLFEAIVLVVIVMFVFLQSWRATLIPAIAVPVVLLGTFGVLAVFGYSINTLTLFGMVLSIGLLVDDAIVVVENVERVMHENPGMSAREATIISMDQVQTALIAIALVLSAVFLPMAFFGGSVGVIYRQFSITIVSSMVLSVVVALVLSPALAAALLKPPGEERHDSNVLDRMLGRFGVRFNAWFDRTAERYQRAVHGIIERKRLAIVVYALVCAVLAALFTSLPTSFLPQEDQGGGMVQYTLPPGATQARTLAVAKAIEDYFLGDERANMETLYTVTGSGPAGTAQNNGRGFLNYTDWDDRKGKANSAGAISQRATQKLSSLRDAQIVALNPPPIRGLGSSSGFTMQLLNTGGLSRAEFKTRLDALMTEARNDSSVTGVRLNSLEDAPALKITVDTAKAGALGVSQAQINSTINAAWGGSYVNDFIDRGRVKRVYIQGDAQYRSRPEDLGDWFVRTNSGTMAPFSSFARATWETTPRVVSRFNGVSAFEIQGDAAEGKSTGQAMNRMTEIAAKLPGVAVDWSGLSYEERRSGGQAPLLYAVSILVVFLCLAALYESWSIPFAVLLVLPLGLVGATIAVALRGMANDVYFQVGLLTTMGLSAKNAILIVEFAELAEKRGASAVAAALEAARLRLRPILMTSLAFMFGVLPLAIATGAGAQSRVAIGTAVIGGVVTGTLLAIFFVPLFFVLVRRLFRPRAGHGRPEATEGAPA